MKRGLSSARDAGAPIHLQEIDCEWFQPHVPASRFALPHNLLGNQREVPLPSNPLRRVRLQRGELGRFVCS